MNYVLNSFVILLVLLLSQSCFATPTQVAITIDDLPVHGELPDNISRTDIINHILDVLAKHHIMGVYGFINGSNALDNEDNRMALQRWVNSKQFLANHSYSHLDLDQVDHETYIKNIQENEPLLSKLMGNINYRYFRYPYLAEGNTQQKRKRVRQFLFTHQYQIAPVTIDFFDYAWNAPYARCLAINNQSDIKWLKQSFINQSLNALIISQALAQMLFARDIKHILLLHVGFFDAMMLDELLTAYEKQGVRFISLREALTDKVYSIDPNVIRNRTYTFLNQIRLAQHKPNPIIVDELYKTLPEEKLDSLCR